jgi:hypothetical protein
LILQFGVMWFKDTYSLLIKKLLNSLNCLIANAHISTLS